MNLKQENNGRVRLRVPASSANLGTGFDVLGMALNLYLSAEVSLSPGNPQLEIIGEGAKELQDDREDNLFTRALAVPFNFLGERLPDMQIRLESQIPFSRGLGSSAAAAVAGFSAANALLGGKISSKELLHMAIKMEGHADNVVAAMTGGLVCVMMYQGQCYYQAVPVPRSLDIVLTVPDFELSTEKSRRALPEMVPLADAVKNLQRCCFLVASFFNRDYTRLDKAMDDIIYQTSRSHLIPGFGLALAAARQAGALGAALSGSGPSVIAFCQTNKEQVGKAMQDAFDREGIRSRIYYLEPDYSGVCFL